MIDSAAMHRSVVGKNKSTSRNFEKMISQMIAFTFFILRPDVAPQVRSESEFRRTILFGQVLKRYKDIYGVRREVGTGSSVMGVLYVEMVILFEEQARISMPMLRLTTSRMPRTCKTVNCVPTL